MSTPLLKSDELRIGFDNGAVILDRAEFSIPRGKRVGLTGPSGSGKSLLAWTILGLLPDMAYASGTLEYCDVKGTRYNLLNPVEAGSIRGQVIAMIPQNPFTSLNPAMTCGSQIAEVFDGSKGVILDHFVKLGFDDPERIFKAYPHELSGGQLQRVVIALATINKPDLLIADEPSTALDTATQKQILDLLIKWHEDNPGSSLLFISHDQAAVKYVCNHLLYVHHGRILQQDAPEHAEEYPKPMRSRSGTASTDVQEVDLVELGGRSVLHLKDVTKSFAKRKDSGRIPAVNKLSLDIEKGEKVGLVGNSGSGKTTVARIIAGLTPPDEGEIEFNGRRLDYNADRGMRSVIQMIFQDPYSSLYPSRTIHYILAESLLAHFKLTELEIDTRIAELMSDVGLPTAHLGKYPWQLSGGERQRVQIARALCAQPELLICDECVTGLDRPVQQRILDLLARLNAELGLTLLFISHDLDVINQLCTRIIVMDNGSVVENGLTEQVIASPKHPSTKTLIESRLSVIS